MSTCTVELLVATASVEVVAATVSEMGAGWTSSGCEDSAVVSAVFS